MKNLFTILVCCLPFAALCQKYQIKIGDNEFFVDSLGGIKFNKELTEFEIRKVPKDSNSVNYRLAYGDDVKEFKTDGDYHNIVFGKDIRGVSMFITDEKKNDLGILFILEKPTGNASRNQISNGKRTVVFPKEKTATEFILTKLYPSITETVGQGLKILTTPSKTRYTGIDFIHIFFDQGGNSLISSIPVGIAGATYVVHVIYLVPKKNIMNVDYKVNQSPADIEEGVVIRGEGSLQDNLQLNALPPGETVELEWKEFELKLTPSSYDIRFDIVRSGFEFNEDGDIEIKAPAVMASRVIKMKRIYHGSIDVAVVKTSLENPTFTLTPSDQDPSLNVVKKTDDGSRVMASAMYTFYFSPIILIEKILWPKRVQNYRLEGRNFADDHKIYERIYPAAGIGLNDRLLNNVYLGGKWEFIRGGSLFLGYHWGKVNVLNVDKDFKFEETIITKESFDLKTNTKWKGAFCIGLNLDIRIITNLFQRNVTAAP